VQIGTSKLENLAAEHQFLSNRMGGYVVPGSAFIISLVPLLPELEVGFPPGQLPWIKTQDLYFGGITKIVVPAAVKGKNIWRRIDPRRLMAMPVPAEECPTEYWYLQDSIETTGKDQYGFVTIQVFDGIQHIKEHASEVPIPKQTTAKQIAAGLVDSWLSFRPTQGQLGFGWVEKKEEIPAKVEELRRLQTLCFADLVTKARTLWGAKKIDQIDDHMRVAADWLGLTGEPWREQIRQKVMKPCLLCREPLSFDAISCPNCGLLPKAYNEAKAMGINLDWASDPFVYPHMAQMTQMAQGTLPKPEIKK